VLAQPQHQRLVEQAARVEILDQRGIGAVEAGSRYSFRRG